MTDEKPLLDRVLEHVAETLLIVMGALVVGMIAFAVWKL